MIISLNISCSEGSKTVLDVCEENWVLFPFPWCPEPGKGLRTELTDVNVLLIFVYSALYCQNPSWMHGLECQQTAILDWAWLPSILILPPEPFHHVRPLPPPPHLGTRKDPIAPVHRLLTRESGENRAYPSLSETTNIPVTWYKYLDIGVSTRPGRLGSCLTF